MPEPVTLEVVVAHLRYQVGAQRLPRQVLPRAPSALSPRLPMAQVAFGRPGMGVPCTQAMGLKIVHQLGSAGHAEP